MASRLCAYLAETLGASDIEIAEITPLSGGAIQENWLLSLHITGGVFEGAQQWVLRKDAPSAVSVSHSRAVEFAVLSHAFGAGVTVPEPICLCEDAAILGSVFFIMRCTSGLAAGHKLAKDPVLKQGSKQLGAQLGYEMAKLHLAPSSSALDLLPAPSPLSPQQQQLREMRGYLDALGTGQPVLEYALNWLEDRLDIWQTDEAKVLCHRDFRTGNFLVEGEAMTALLDWEFAGFSDRHEDIGWLCARCWRFGNPHLTVGGLAPFAAFQQAYEKAYGQPIHLLAMACWQVMAEIRWAVIALQQANRNDSGAEYSLQLALSGQMVPEMEYHMLSLIEEIDQNKWQDYRQ